MKVKVKEETIVKKIIVIECEYDIVKKFVDYWRRSALDYGKSPDETYDLVKPLIDSGL